MKGSESNDAIYINNNKLYSKTNHMGGILGGISNGMDIIASVAFKPTPTINISQNTVNYVTLKEEKITNNSNRNDPTIVIRGQVVVESYIAIAIYELMLRNRYN
jgi:chorismate synthase